MSKILKLNSIVENRGSLTVIEKILPFNIKRVYYIYNLDDSIRGNHRHRKTIQAAVCVSGSCTISCQSGNITIFDPGFPVNWKVRENT